MLPVEISGAVISRLAMGSRTTGFAREAASTKATRASRAKRDVLAIDRVGLAVVDGDAHV
jgi:hypothetical protein